MLRGVGGEDFGFGVVEEGGGDVADAGVADDGRGRGDVEDGVWRGRGVAEVAEEDADGVEGGGEVVRRPATRSSVLRAREVR